MIKTFEQKPPQIQAIQFDGTNAQEIAEFTGVPVPDIETATDGSRFITLLVDRGWMGTQPIHVNETNWVQMVGIPSVIDDATLQAQYRPIS